MLLKEKKWWMLCVNFLINNVIYTKYFVHKIQGRYDDGTKKKGAKEYW